MVDEALHYFTNTKETRSSRAWSQRRHRITFKSSGRTLIAHNDPLRSRKKPHDRTQRVQSDGNLIPIWMVIGRGTFSAAPVQRQPSTRPGRHRRVLKQTERHLFILDLVV